MTISSTTQSDADQAEALLVVGKILQSRSKATALPTPSTYDLLRYLLLKQEISMANIPSITQSKVSCVNIRTVKLTSQTSFCIFVSDLPL